MLQIQKEGNRTPSLTGQSGTDVLEEEELLATILGFSREIELIRTYRCVCVWVYVYTERISWLLWLWKLRSPASCHLQVGESGELVVKFSLSLKPWELGVAWGRANGVSADLVWKPKNQCPRAREDGDLSSSIENVFALPPPFCCIQALNGLDEVLPYCCSLYCLLNQMLISSGNTLIDTPRNSTFTICLGIAQPSWYIKLTVSVAIFGDYLSRRHSF